MAVQNGSHFFGYRIGIVLIFGQDCVKCGDGTLRVISGALEQTWQFRED